MDMVTPRDERRRSAQHLGWWLGLRGLLTVLFGILALARPGVGLAMLIAIFAFYAFADGLTALVEGFRGARHGANRVLLFLEGLVGIAAGVLALAMPGPVAIVVLVIIAVRALALGILEAAAAIGYGHELANPWLVGLGGLASIVFGILLLVHPSAGLLALAWLVGLYALVVGALEVAAAFWVGSELRHTRPTQPAT